MSKPSSPSPNANKFWLLLSGLSHPIWFPLLFLYLPHFQGDSTHEPYAIPLTILLVILLPAGVGLIKLIRGKEAQQLNVDQKSRTPLYLMLGLGSFVSALLWGSPQDKLLLCWGAFAAISLLINRFSRVSFHTGGIAMLIMLFILFQKGELHVLIPFGMFCLLIIAAFSRYKLKAHDLKELLLGLMVAGLSMAIGIGLISSMNDFNSIF